MAGSSRTPRRHGEHGRGEHRESALRTIARLAVALGLIALACAPQPPPRSEILARLENVRALDARLTRAHEGGLDLLAPHSVAVARQSLAQAFAAAQRGQAGVAERLAQDGLDRLDRAIEASSRASRALREVFEPRRRAIEAGAPTLLPQRFQELEERLRAAARQAEEGDLESAEAAVPGLLEGYARVGLEAEALGKAP